MNREQYLLLLLMEEAAEVSQVASKTVRFGLDSSNPVHPEEGDNEYKLNLEWNDMIAIMEVLEDEGIVTCKLNREAIDKKKKKLNKYYAMSQGLGKVE
jgi:hypothetical protein